MAIDFFLKVHFPLGNLSKFASNNWIDGAAYSAVRQSIDLVQDIFII